MQKCNYKTVAQVTFQRHKCVRTQLWKQKEGKHISENLEDHDSKSQEDEENTTASLIKDSTIEDISESIFSGPEEDPEAHEHVELLSAINIVEQDLPQVIQKQNVFHGGPYICL